MSLFVVNRYQGNEEAAVAPDSTNSEDHLTALLKKIEERKKRKSTTNEKEVENAEGEPSETPVPKKKRKKHKTSVLDDSLAADKSKESNHHEHHKTPENSSVAKEDDNAANKPREIVTEAGDPRLKPSAKKQQDFTILGSDSRKKIPAVKRVLPNWLLKPELITSDLNSGPPLSDVKFVLDDKIIDVLKKNGTKRLFPVQANIIPWILECDKHRKADWWPQDVCVSAPTGSGKTLAYVLPIIQQLQYRLIKKIRCLVVLPVQELAAQVYNVMKTYTAQTKLRVALLSGAASFEQEQSNLVRQITCGKYISRVDIVVTTPGRLIDHIEKTRGFSLASLRFLVIDEADRDSEWLHRLPAPHYSTAPRNMSTKKSSANQPAQKLLFSATLSQDPEKLSRLGLFQPKLFTSVQPEDKDYDLNLDKEGGDFAGRYTSPDELVERAVECEPIYKPLALFQLLTENDGPQRTLVFVNSGTMAHKLSLLIRTLGKEKGITVADLSALSAPSKRENVLNEFSRGKIQVLVSADTLARGMDIPGLKLVVSYDLPKDIKGYIHRSGRTGRAGNAGTAISLLTPGQVAVFSRMLGAARKTVPEIEKRNLEPFADSIDYAQHLDELKEILVKEETEALISLKTVKRKHRKQATR